MRLGRRALLAGLAGLAMPDPTAARLALRAAAAGARDRLANRQSAILGLAGDENGNVTIAGTDLIPFRLLSGIGVTQRVQFAHNPSGRVWAHNELIEAIPLDDRAPLGYRVAGRPGTTIFAQLIWSPGTSFVSGNRVDEPWMVHTGSGALTPIGTWQFPPHTPETTKTTAVPSWNPLTISDGDTSQLYRAVDGRFSVRSRRLENSLVDGLPVYPFYQFHPATGWTRDEPNLRQYYGAEISNSDNGRAEALDIAEDGTAVFIDTGGSVTTFLSDLKAVWRKPPGGTLALWATQRWGSVYQAQPPSTSSFIDCIDAGSGLNRVSSYGVTNISTPGVVARYVNVFRSDRLVTDHDDHGQANPFFYAAIASANDSMSYISTWRADGGVYWLRNAFVFSPESRPLRLDFGDGDESWATVGTWDDTEPLVTTMFSLGLAPYRNGLFGRRNRAGLSGTGNFFDAVNYYGPATLAGEGIRTIWHIQVATTSVTRRAVVSVVTPTGTAGNITGQATANGKLYFSTGAGTSIYSNPYIDPGIYEVDPVTYGVRQVCGMPAGLAAGGWGTIWGDRRSVAV